MGIIRFIFALLVVLSHWGMIYGGYNFGVMAVIGFFIISGLVMTALLRQNYPRAQDIPAFYIDRLARLFPQFLFYTSVAAVAFSRHWLSAPFWVADFTPWKIAINFLMLPNGFYMLGWEKSLLLPQSWTLGLELCFYLSLPWLLLYTLRIPAALLSLLIFGLAWSGSIATDAFGYRLLPGTLFIFLCGSWIYDIRQGRDSPSLKISLLMIWLVALILLHWTRTHPALAVPNNLSVLSGLALTLPLIYRASLWKPFTLERRLGDLSYGIYLNHFIVIWFVQRFCMPQFTPAVALWLVISVSCALAWLTYTLIEHPVLRWRHRFRQAHGHSYH